MAAFGTGNQPAAAVPTGGAAGFGTFNLPNFVGELFKLSPLETPLLSLIGGLTGGQQTNSVKFTWQDTLHRAPALTHASRGRIEGDDATFSVQSRSERVNVVELEPALDEMARRCSELNFNVLAHPRVRRIYNDGREFVLTSKNRYDLVISEPSNPYRAGVAVLYTAEFYEAVRRRLNPGSTLRTDAWLG